MRARANKLLPALEDELCGELNIARVARARDNTESCVGLNEARRKTSGRSRWVNVKCRCSSGIEVLRVIQNIEQLGPELKILALRKAEVLKDGHIPIVYAGAAHDTAPCRPVCEESRRKRCRIEPLRQTPVALRIPDEIRPECAAGAKRISEREKRAGWCGGGYSLGDRKRRAALRRENARHLEAT